MPASLSMPDNQPEPFAGAASSRPIRSLATWLNRLAVLVLAGWTSALAAQPAVVVSIKPLHSLVAAVMLDIGEPMLLLDGGSSPHGFVLKPSQARAISRADLVVWVGPGLESPLTKALATLGRDARSLPVIELPALHRLPVRDTGAFANDGHDPDHDHRHDAASGAPNIDTHLWLDPHNARIIAAALVEALVAIDPVHAARYQHNGSVLDAQLVALDHDLAKALASVRQVPFLLFHDAFQYFEHRYLLAAIGTIAVDPERAPGARRIQQMRARVARTGAQCVFAEPQFPAAMTRLVTEGGNVRAGMLDPLGSKLPAGPAQYPAMMRALADSLLDCLRAR
ncbi:MAG: zinc ABC transporter substrate-binding protein [Burkholderiaceae bacterium]